MESRSDKQIFLIIHCDDIGMSHSVNKAAFKAYEKGIISSGSIMVPCPWFPEAAAYFREHPEFDVGVHLTLTSEWRLYRWSAIAREGVPGLVDDDGFLWRRVPDVIFNAKSEEVEAEIRAQIQRAEHFGIKPTHLDPHMGTIFAKREFLEVYRKVAEEYGIFPMLPLESERIPPHLGNVFKYGSQEIHIKFLYMGSREEKKTFYHQTLREMKPGVNEVIVHLGGDDEEIEAIMGEHAEYRLSDFLIFSDPTTQQIIKQRDIKLVGFRDLVSY